MSSTWKASGSHTKEMSGPTLITRMGTIPLCGGVVKFLLTEGCGRPRMNVT